MEQFESKQCKSGCGIFLNSTIGKKSIVAITGLILFSFLIGHMIGNLKAFGGVDVSGVHKLDHYAEFLRSIAKDLLGEANFLWIMRAGLLATLLVHIAFVIQLMQLNASSRPVAYVKTTYISATVPARLMFLGGIVILIFVVLHILHFTTGTIHTGNFEHGKVYSNIHSAFKVWYAALAYIVAMLAVAMHVYHGVWSLFQTLGLDNPDRNCTLRFFSKFAAILLLLGFVSVPCAFVAGILPAPTAFVSIPQGYAAGIGTITKFEK